MDDDTNWFWMHVYRLITCYGKFRITNSYLWMCQWDGTYYIQRYSQFMLWWTLEVGEIEHLETSLKEDDSVYYESVKDISSSTTIQVWKKNLNFVANPLGIYEKRVYLLDAGDSFSYINTCHSFMWGVC